jgi:peptidoglycan glycosyltransferase
MNRTLRSGGTAVVLLIVALLLNITYIQVIRSTEYRNDPLNRRILYEEVSRLRGQITAGGKVLAKSERSDDSYRYQRSYPEGPGYANLTGYFSLRYTPVGIEQSQDELLSGEAADLLVDRVGDLITGRDPRGGSVELTIVPKVQEVAYNELTTRGLTGAVVAIRPSTGEILALATSPSYDPNPLASHSDAEQRAAFNALHAATAVPSPLENRAIDRVYPPGSTFKLLVSSAALSQGLSPQTPLTAEAAITLPGTDGVQLQNFGGERCADESDAEVSLTVALAHSCNTAFAQLGMQIGAEGLRRQAAAFGINGEAFDIGLVDGTESKGGLTVQPSRLGDMPDEAAVAQSSIGQRDVALTPLQTAVITATIANKGQRMLPYLIARTTAPDLKELSAAVPTTANATALTAEAAAQLTAMMVESEGVTGGENQIADVQIASKTGTAEHGVDPKNTPPYVSYAAFAPADNPKVAVVVFIEGGQGVDVNSTGRTVAAPIGRLVIAAALQGG